MLCLYGSTVLLLGAENGKGYWRRFLSSDDSWFLSLGNDLLGPSIGKSAVQIKLACDRLFQRQMTVYYLPWFDDGTRGKVEIEVVRGVAEAGLTNNCFHSGKKN